MAFYTLPLPNDKSSIRLFSLHGAVDRKSPLSGTLSVDKLTSNPQYEALSYTWGDPEPIDEVTINGNDTLPIGASLAGALRALRLQHKARVVWIDALCINQKDFSEKNFQVPMMRQIYATCSRTIIWLGDSDEQSRKAFEVIRKSPKVYTAAIDGVLTRPWFRRVWVIQECAFAPEVEVQCGEDRIDWDSLAGVCSLVSRLRRMVDIDATKDSKIFHPAFYPRIMDTARRKVKNGERLQALEALRSFRSFDATNGLDKVYGILGFLEDPDFITVDYNKSVQEVFSDVASATIRKSQNLDVLRECLPKEIAPSPSGVPSWVPDWTDAEQDFEQDVEIFAIKEVYHASRNIPFGDPTVSVDGSLQVSAHFITTIAEMAQPWKTVEEIRDLIWSKGHRLPRKRAYELPCYLLELYENWQDVARRINGEQGTLQDKYITNESILEAWSNTYFHNAPPFSDYNDARKFEKWIYSVDLGIRAFRFWRRNVVERLPWMLIYLVSGPFVFLTAIGTLFLFISGRIVLEPPEWEQTAFRSLWEIGRTENGLLGMFPAKTFAAPKAISTKAGDSVVILKGGARPLVLREHGKKWRVVGDAYVHAIMHGAAFHESKCVSIELA